MKKQITTFFSSLLVWSAMAQIPSYVPQQGLVYYSSMDYVIKDESPTKAVPTVMNASLQDDVYEQRTHAASFASDKNIQYNTSDYPQLQPDTAITIACWSVITEGTSTYPTVVEAGDDYFIRYRRTAGGYDIEVGVRTGQNTYSTIEKKGLYQKGTWNHIAMTYSKSAKKLALFIDGIEQTSVSADQNIFYLPNNVLKIGGNVDGLKQFAGKVDDLMIYNRALKPSEILAIKNANRIMVYDYYNSLSFDGVDDIIEIPALNLNSNTVTIETWVCPKSVDTYDGFIVCRAGNTVAGLIATGQKRYGYMWNNIYYDWEGAPLITMNKWTHLALVIEPTKATLYVDGVPYVNNKPHQVEEFDGITIIGADPYSARKVHAIFDEVRIWTVARTEQQIKDYMTCPLKVYLSGLGSYLSDEGPELKLHYTFYTSQSNSTTFLPMRGEYPTLKNFNFTGNSAWKISNAVPFINPKLYVNEQNPSQLSSHETQAVYNWFLVGQSASLGETERTITMNNSGSYYVTLQKGNCVMNSEVYTYVVTSVDTPTDWNFSFYPNPAQHTLYLSEEVEQIVIYNQLGQEIIQASGKIIDVHSLQQGNYIVKVKHADKIGTYQLAIQ